MRRTKRNLLDEASLYDYAIGALSRKMRTVAELKRLLRHRCPQETTIARVVARLKERNYLSDANYAATFAASRRDNQKFGRRRVITDLKVKGVHAEVIGKAVEEVFSGIDEASLARAFLRRKRLKKPTTNREAARVFRALIRAGFGVSASIKVLKNWDVEDEVLTALAEEAES
jgi:regulatory protein